MQVFGAWVQTGHWRRARKETLRLVSALLMSGLLAAALTLVSLSTLACGPSAGEVPVCGPEVFQLRYTPRGGGASEASAWLSFPWPSDLRRTVSGGLDLQNFPNPVGADLVENYLAAAASLDGYGTNAPVYFSFNTALDPESLPPQNTAAASSAEAQQASVQLIDVDPNSPERGRRFPLRWRYDEPEGVFLPAHALAVAPAWGFPLRPATRYAIVLSTALKNGAGDALTPPPLFSASLGATASCEGPVPGVAQVAALTSLHASLKTLWQEEGNALETIAGATVFTTQHVVDDLQAIYADVHARPAPPLLDAWQPIGGSGETYRLKQFQWTAGKSVRFDVYEGRYDSPNYQEGQVPYGSRGGGFKRDANGKPVPARTEQLRFVLAVPQTPPPDGGPCYPLVEYAHGTGGDAYGFTYETAGRLAGRGLASIGIDQPLHGPRAEGQQFDVDLMSFNVINPAAGRTNFRQSAADTFSLTRFARESLKVPAGVARAGKALCFDPARTYFFGHSHGGLSGAMVAAIEQDLSAYVLSGAGGGLSITLMERTYPLDIKQTMEQLLALDPADEVLTELHPVVAIMQILSEVTDPINYAARWLQRPEEALGWRPAHLLLTSGSLDADTPWRTATAMNVAGGVPPMRPLEVPSQSFETAGLASINSPASLNLAAGTATGAFLQWKGENHFVIFNRPEAIHASMEFLRSAAYDSAPVIVRDPNTKDR